MDVISLKSILKDTKYENREDEIWQNLINLAVKYNLEPAEKTISPAEYIEKKFIQLKEKIGEDFKLVQLYFADLVKKIQRDISESKCLDYIAEMKDEEKSIDLLTEWILNAEE
ncbi:hypothetical protein HZA39_04595 [Candidatus Peregrinibacteria bacterium]|nr:hypothetical protein [Candidatus Peregrinibacteria bacterium]